MVAKKQPELDNCLMGVQRMAQLDEETLAQLEYLAYRVRWHTVDIARDHLKMHFGAVFSITEIVVMLYFNWMRHDAQDPC